jgi:DNA-binding LacI/PurR family transcriptional regulator
MKVGFMTANVERRARRGRPPVVSEAIADDLRMQIANGVLAPGMRVPTRQELEARYEASTATVQSVMKRLVEDGLVEVRGTVGTFVAGQPRHITDVALVFPVGRNDPFLWRRLYDSLISGAAGWSGPDKRRFPVYYCKRSEDRGGETGRLRDDIRTLRVGAVIHCLAMTDAGLLSWEQEFEVPYVGLMTAHSVTDTPARVAFSYKSFFSRAVEHLAARGRKRICVLLDPYQGLDIYDKHIEREAARFGVEIRPWYRQFVSLSEPVCAQSSADLLMRLPAGDRPDGMIVADDNLGPHAVAGLRSAGVRIGTDIDVVVHANFPGDSNLADASVTRLGFDSRTALESAVALIDQWRETGKPGGRAEVPAVFENELK